MLDEPTNDLDIESLELLESTLQSYTGTLLLVSHDRAFLDNVVTQTLAAEQNGVWKEYAGGYSDWLAQRPKADTDEAVPAARPQTVTRDKPKAKMSFKEQRELAGLPAEIETLEQEQQALTARMSGVNYHKQGAEAIKVDRLRATEIEQHLAKKYERWEILDQKVAPG